MFTIMTFFFEIIKNPQLNFCPKLVFNSRSVSDHFVDVNKTIQMPKGATKDVPDFMLTRYACYLIAQNGDPKKEQIAFAKSYFAIQTRRFTD